MTVTVGTLKKMLGDFPDDRQVYVVHGDGMTQPKLTEAFLDPEMEKELPEEDRIGKFVLITGEN
jgi:hypothetical protein